MEKDRQMAIDDSYLYGIMTIIAYIPALDII